MPVMADMDDDWRGIAREIEGCALCAGALPFPPSPVLQGSGTARIILISQAPGNRAHLARRPFADASGHRLRGWLGLTPETFYDPARLAIMPMAFCYPGSSGGGDRPPPPVCAATWHRRLLPLMPNLELTLLVGRLAQLAYLPESVGLADTVARFKDCRGPVVPLPHPSWHNNAWLRQHSWFEDEMLPCLRRRVGGILARD